MSRRTKICHHCGGRFPRYLFARKGTGFRHCPDCRREWGKQQHRIEAARPPDEHFEPPQRDSSDHPMRVIRNEAVGVTYVFCSCGYSVQTRSHPADYIALHGGYLEDLTV